MIIARSEIMVNGNLIRETEREMEKRERELKTKSVAIYCESQITRAL